ncbi:MAG: peptidoglycan DL-endopeptidase CwlO [Blastococcus sp.]|nr:peptidoglycan DL-endopeptidase CwlO [Blastococcus sp.]
MPAPRTTVRPAAGIRPQLSPAEIAFLREKLAREQAGRPAGGARTSGRPPAKRGAPARKPAKKSPAARRKAARQAARSTRAEQGRRWSRPLVVGPLGILLVAGALCVVLPGSSPQGSAGRDVTALALTAKATLVEQADHYRVLERAVAARRLELGKARESQQAAAARVATRRAVVGRTAAALYSAVPGSTYPVPTLPPTGRDVVLGGTAAVASDVRSTLAGAQEATSALDAATHRVGVAATALAAATTRAADALVSSRSTVAALSPEIVVRLASLDVVTARSAEQARNATAVRRWQTYLAELAAADITPPPAADLTADDLPSGLSPALDHAGKPVPGLAWGVVGNRPVAVLPAETVAAESNALSQLGRPYVAGTSGPVSYDCGGFTAANWLLAGYALPATPADQLSAGTPVTMSNAQVGDLVVSPGGRDVGIYLGSGDVIGASASTQRVTIRGVLAGSTAVRVPVSHPGSWAAVAPGVARTGTCGAPLRHGSYDDPAWGGYRNGQIPAGSLCGLGVAHHVLRCDAAASYREMANAYATEFGTPMCITDSYRPLGAQEDAFSRKPELAAVPGTSNHGWALAVDLCGGIGTPSSPQGRWMAANAGRFGFVNPDWAAPHGEKPEPWHWEYGYIS